MILQQKNIAIAVVIFVLLVVGCRRVKVDNPYEEIDYTVANDNPSPQDIPTDNFAYLHAKIFSPTCANAGCHDGTFEPEFRSVASSYNTLVNHPVIANDAQNSYEFRVVPGSVENSFLHLRLTESIPNTTGMMPPEVDPDSDWPQNREDYIALIENWIASGAPDMFGNQAPGANADFPPTVEGLAVFPAGNTSDPYERDESEAQRQWTSGFWQRTTALRSKTFQLRWRSPLLWKILMKRIWPSAPQRVVYRHSTFSTTLRIFSTRRQ